MLPKRYLAKKKKVEIESIRVVDSISDITKNLQEHPFAVSKAVLCINADIIGIHRRMKGVALAQNTEELELATSLVDKHETDVYKHFTLIDERFLGDKTRIEKERNLFADWKPIRAEVIVLTREVKNKETARAGSRHGQ